MIALAERRPSRAVSYLSFLVLIAAGIAGCSADTARFNDSPFSSPYASRNAPPPSETTSSVPRAQASPVAHVETQQLPPPPSPRSGSSTDAAPGRSEVTGSIGPASGTPRRSSSNWHWEGGTAITVNPGDTIDTISHRYGVPSSAIMQANNITAPASIQPGQRLVIPQYHYGSRPRRDQAPATPIASNATMVPATVGGGLHVVAPGESLISIARLYHKPRKVIAKANNIAPDAKLKIGQHLAIPGVKPAPAQAVAANPAMKPAAVGPAPRRSADAGAGAKGHGAQPPPAAPATNLKIAAGAAPAASAHVAAPAADPTTEQTAGTTPGETKAAGPGFRWPVRGRIITGFGPKTNGQQNDGINLAVPEGTSVKAAEDGVVAYAGNELKGYGNLVLVRHSNGFVTAYAHASEIMVKRGDQVKRGQIIARAGQTGSVSSPQLHFEIRKGASPVDPTQYLSGT